MSVLAFVDTETTGLDPDQHDIWEVGLILTDQHGGETERGRWFLPVDLGRADPMALKIGKFHARYIEGQVTPPREFAETFARVTVGAHLVGAVVSFDEERLRRLLRFHGQCPMWHYHLVDVEALVAGKYGIDPPWDSNELSKAAGVDPDHFDRHTAMGDAEWALALYRAVMG